MKSANILAYYPEEQSLYEGRIALDPSTNEETGRPITHVTVEGYPHLNFCLHKESELPLRTRHVATFLNQCMVVTCMVDAELVPQPNLEEVARTIVQDQLNVTA